MNNQRKADLGLVFVTLTWGLSYYFVNIGLTECGPFGQNAFRFGLAFVVAYTLGRKQMNGISGATIKYAALIGLALVGTYLLNNYGIMYTSLSNAGFLCALACVLTPLLGMIFKRRMPEKKFGIVIVLCTAGVALLSLSESFRPALGDILCIGCSICYAADILLTETAVSHEDVDAFQLGVLQLGFTALYLLPLAVLTGDNIIPKTPRVWGALLFLSFFCTGVAFIVQAIAQQYTSGNHVGVIFTLEPVFAAVAAYFLAGEVLKPRGYLGALLMILAILIMELELPFGKEKRGAEIESEKT